MLSKSNGKGGNGEVESGFQHCQKPWAMAQLKKCPLCQHEDMTLDPPGPQKRMHGGEFAGQTGQIDVLTIQGETLPQKIKVESA